MSEITEKALTKISEEFKIGKYSKYGEAVKNPAYIVTQTFIRAEEEFAQAVVDSKETFSEAVESAVKGCGSAISDLAVYRGIAKFYFKSATVHFIMQIDLCGQPDDFDSQPKEEQVEKVAPSERNITVTSVQPPEEEKKSVLSMDFDDLFGD